MSITKIWRLLGLIDEWVSPKKRKDPATEVKVGWFSTRGGGAAAERKSKTRSRKTRRMRREANAKRAYNRSKA